MHLSDFEPDVTLRRFTVEEWHKMIEAGVLGEDEHVELVEGRCYAMTPQSEQHSIVIARLTRLLVVALSSKYSVRPQLPLTLGPDSEPEPDFAVVRAADELPPEHPRSALLVVEVARSSLAYDRQVKVPLYARAGIPEVWIVDVEGRAVEVYTGPQKKAGSYKTKSIVASGQTLTSSSLPEIKLQVAALFR